MEIGFTLQKIERIGINNFSGAAHYRWRPDNGWTAQPMQLPSGGWKPLLPDPTYLRTLQRANVPIEGLQILTRDRPDSVEFIAPELNMFMVRVQYKTCASTASDCGVRYTQIKIGEQPRSLFEPDAAQPVENLNTPGGVIRVPVQ
jgi:hypothetical protein